MFPNMYLVKVTRPITLMSLETACQKEHAVQPVSVAGVTKQNLPS